MTREEALKVVRVALGADGGCWNCVRVQVRELRDALPEHDWVALAIEVDPDIVDTLDDLDGDGD